MLQNLEHLFRVILEDLQQRSALENTWLFSQVNPHNDLEQDQYAHEDLEAAECDLRCLGLTVDRVELDDHLRCLSVSFSFESFRLPPLDPESFLPGQREIYLELSRICSRREQVSVSRNRFSASGQDREYEHVSALLRHVLNDLTLGGRSSTFLNSSYDLAVLKLARDYLAGLGFKVVLTLEGLTIHYPPSLLATATLRDKLSIALEEFTGPVVAAQEIQAAPVVPSAAACLAGDVPENPLQYFECGIEQVGQFDSGQDITILPDGGMYGITAINNWFETSRTSPLSRQVILAGTQLYIYKNLVDYIADSSSENLLKLCQDPQTKEIMENPRIVTYYDNSGRAPVVQAVICDKTTVGAEKLSPDRKKAFFNSDTIGDEHIKNIAFDSLGDFIKHPKISELLISPLVPPISPVSLIGIKKAYFKNRNAFFGPVDLGFYKSHAAKVAAAETVAEVENLLLANYKEGGTNASTKTVIELGLRR